MAWKFTFKSELDPIAVISFGLSIVAMSWHVWNLWQGPKVQIIRPDSVLIARSNEIGYQSRRPGSHVYFIVSVDSINNGAPGHDAVIIRERLIIEISGKKFEHNWFRFVKTDNKGLEGKELVVRENYESASTYPVKAGSSSTHETFFLANPKKCERIDTNCEVDDNYLEWEEFLGLVKGETIMSLTIAADVVGEDEPSTAKCELHIGQDQLENFENQKWSTPLCL